MQFDKVLAPRSSDRLDTWRDRRSRILVRDQGARHPDTSRPPRPFGTHLETCRSGHSSAPASDRCVSSGQQSTRLLAGAQHRPQKQQYHGKKVGSLLREYEPVGEDRRKQGTEKSGEGLRQPGRLFLPRSAGQHENEGALPSRRGPENSVSRASCHAHRCAVHCSILSRTVATANASRSRRLRNVC